MPKVKRRIVLVNPRRRRRLRNAPRPWSALYRAHYYGKKKPRVRRNRARHRRRNVGEIIGVGLNPAPIIVNVGGTKRVRRVRKRRYNARRRARRSPLLLLPRRHNPFVFRARRRRSRRNPDSPFVATAKNVAGVLGGATLTKLISERLPYNLSQGPIGYVTAGVVAYVIGFSARRFAKNEALGDNLALGGYVYLGLRILNDFLPSVSQLSPIGLRGTGAIVPSQGFAVPLVNQPNSMTQFVTPGFVSAAIPNTMSGLNAGRRLSRIR